MKQLDILPVRPLRGGLHVTEDWLHETIQGEGTYVGMPSLFVRLFGCNLACANCDTKYTWHPEKTTTSRVLPVTEVLDAIIKKSEKWRYSPLHLVITGGEPMLQVDALNELLYADIMDEYAVTIETNGTICDPLTADVVHLASLSPKLSWLRDYWSKTHRYTVPASLFDWMTTTRRGTVQMKLVVENDDDLREAINFYEYLRDDRQLMDSENLIIQPEWGTYGTNLKQVMPAVVASGFRVLPQSHKTWGVY